MNQVTEFWSWASIESAQPLDGFVFSSASCMLPLETQDTKFWTGSLLFGRHFHCVLKTFCRCDFMDHLPTGCGFAIRAALLQFCPELVDVIPWIQEMADKPETCQHRTIIPGTLTGVYRNGFHRERVLTMSVQRNCPSPECGTCFVQGLHVWLHKTENREEAILQFDRVKIVPGKVEFYDSNAPDNHRMEMWGTTEQRWFSFKWAPMGEIRSPSVNIMFHNLINIAVEMLQFRWRSAKQHLFTVRKPRLAIDIVDPCREYTGCAELVRTHLTQATRLSHELSTQIISLADVEEVCDHQVLIDNQQTYNDMTFTLERTCKSTECRTCLFATLSIWKKGQCVLKTNQVFFRDTQLLFVQGSRLYREPVPLFTVELDRFDQLSFYQTGITIPTIYTNATHINAWLLSIAMETQRNVQSRIFVRDETGSI